MKADQCLDRLREAIKALTGDTFKSSYAYSAKTKARLEVVAAFKDLDRWIQYVGELPEEWQPRKGMPT